MCGRPVAVPSLGRCVPAPSLPRCERSVTCLPGSCSPYSTEDSFDQMQTTIVCPSAQTASSTTPLLHKLSAASSSDSIAAEQENRALRASCRIYKCVVLQGHEDVSFGLNLCMAAAAAALIQESSSCLALCTALKLAQNTTISQATCTQQHFGLFLVIYCS